MFNINDVVYHVSLPSVKMTVVEVNKYTNFACCQSSYSSGTWYSCKDLRLDNTSAKQMTSLKSLVDEFVTSSTFNDVINNINSNSTVEQLETNIVELQRLRYAADCIINGCTSAISKLKSIDNCKSEISEIPASLFSKINGKQVQTHKYNLGDKVYYKNTAYDAGTIIGTDKHHTCYLLGWTTNAPINSMFMSDSNIKACTPAVTNLTKDLSGIKYIVYCLESSLVSKE